MHQHQEEAGLDESVDLDESVEDSVSTSYKQLYEDNKPSSTTLPGMKASYSNPANKVSFSGFGQDLKQAHKESVASNSPRRYAIGRDRTKNMNSAENIETFTEILKPI